jgi:hypothetical protein
MAPLALTLLLLSAAPATPEAWARAACPVKPAPKQDSNVEMKGRESARTECLRRAMNRALDRVLLPLKSAKSPRFPTWMALQAEHNRWVREACAQVEDATWLDLSRGVRSWGTGYGYALMACEQREHAARGLFADRLARGEPVQLAPADATKAAAARAHYVKALETAAKRAPVAPVQDSQTLKQLSRAELQALAKEVAQLQPRAEALAKQQCALLAKPPAGCEAKLAAQLLAPIEPRSGQP